MHKLEHPTGLDHHQGVAPIVIVPRPAPGPHRDAPALPAKGSRAKDAVQRPIGFDFDRISTPHAPFTV
jgi:hypothetical protein